MVLLRDPTNSWTCITRVPTAHGLVTVRLLTAKDLEQLRTAALSDESLGRHAIVRLCSRNPADAADDTDKTNAVFANSLTPAEIDVLANVVAALNAIRVVPGESNAVGALGQAIARKIERSSPGAVPESPVFKAVRPAAAPSNVALTKRLALLTLRGAKP